MNRKPKRRGNETATVSWRRRLEPAAVYAVALIIRLRVIQSAPQPDEAFHLATARQLGQADAGLHGLTGPFGFQLAETFLGRPLFYLGLHVPAQFSLEAARVLNVLVTSLLPVLAVLILRRTGVSLPYRLGAAGVIALHPLFATWGSLLQPHSAAALLLALAYWAQLQDHAWPAGLALAAAVLCDRLAAWGGLVLLALSLGETLKTPAPTRWPLRLTRLQSFYAVILAGLPLALSFSKVPAFGLQADLSILDILGRSTLTLWLLPVVILALWAPASRSMAAVALAYVLVFLLAQLGLGRTAGGAQYVAPAFFSLVAGTGALHAAIGIRPRAGWASAVLVAILLPVLVSSPTAATILYPGQPEFAFNMAAAEVETAIAGQVSEAVAWIEGGDWPLVLLIDVDPRYLHEPFRYSLATTRINFAYTSDPKNVTAWPEALETPNLAVLLSVQPNEPARIFPGALTDAIRTVYGECTRESNDAYVLMEPADCRGRGAELIEEYHARRRAAKEATP